jgi:hypothetical protein
MSRKYLHDTKDLELVLHPVENYNDPPLQFYCYVDASIMVFEDNKL